MFKHLLVFSGLAGFAFSSGAQTFVNLNNGFPINGNGAAAFADYDLDGDMDLAFAGFNSAAGYFGNLYNNQGNGNFTPVSGISFPAANGSVNWGDYDNDGDPDLLVTGQDAGLTGRSTLLLRNDGNNLFTEVVTGLPDIEGIARWIDYDNDGWQDVVMAGVAAGAIWDSLWLFKNNSSVTFSQTPVNLPGCAATDISLTDYNNDGMTDFFVMGRHFEPGQGGKVKSTLYENTGFGLFTPVPFNFEKLTMGTSDWGDFDNDGDPDLIYDGVDTLLSGNKTLLYRNDNNGSFAPIGANLPMSGEPGSVNWGDCDNDGDLDILIGGPTVLLRNDGNAIFTDITPLDFPYGAPNYFVDYDSDNDLDILFLEFSISSSIFRNDLITAVAEENQNWEFYLSPNPATTSLTLNANNLKDYCAEIQIMNSLGKMIFHFPSVNFAIDPTIDIDGLSSGIYAITATFAGKQQTITRKFLVE